MVTGKWQFVQAPSGVDEEVKHALQMAAAYAERDLSRSAGPANELRDERGQSLEEAPDAMARLLAPNLHPDDPSHEIWLTRVAEGLIGGAHRIGREDDQSSYEAAFLEWKEALDAIELHLSEHRFVLGPVLSYADLLLFAFAVRLDGVYFALFKANPYLLEDLPNLHAFARDVFELPAVHENTSFAQAIGAAHRTVGTQLNPRGLVPLGGRPDLDAPHFRDQLGVAHTDTSIEEDPSARRAAGEWVRGVSRLRDRVGTENFPAEAGRYHLFAPYNCPWSHRALLARAVKGLENVVGASVVYFRRHLERGWQLNPAIPDCDEDPIHGRRFVVEYYEAEGSAEKSVPILYDRVSNRIVNNESAEILRMFDTAFGDLAESSLSLYPHEHAEALDRVNEQVYQRINNGAYKAGFASSQHAYERAYARYFAGLRWVDGLLAKGDWLVGSSVPTEADLRLFPTVFRHDAVYYARFRLNGARIRDFPRLERWLARMLAWPGVGEASNLDHARNGYFGRSGNEIVPFGPTRLGFSSKDFTRAQWLGEPSERTK